MVQAALCLVCGAASAQQVVDGIAAVVNGEYITLSDLDERIKPYVLKMMEQNRGALPPQAIMHMRKTVLEAMISSMLLKQEAERLKIEVTEVEIQNSIRTFLKDNNLTESAFEEQLKLKKSSRKEYADQMREQMLRAKLVSFMVKRKITVTDDEVRNFLTSGEAVKKADQGRFVRFELIMTPPNVDLKALRAKIESGAMSFADAASKNSIGPGAQFGGDLGRLKFDELGQEMQAVVNALKPGELSPVFQVEGQNTLIRLKEADAPTAPKVEPGAGPVEITDELRRKVEGAKFDAKIGEYVQELRKRALIRINL